MKSIKIECVGYSIAADWYEGMNDEVMLVLPGYTSSKAKFTKLVISLVEKTGTSALVIDYSGHGESPFDIKDLSPAQNFIEVIAAYDWLAKNHSDLKINVMGTSYGGYFAALLTKYRSIYKLILRVPAIYPESTFYTKWRDVDRPHAREYRHSKEKVSSNPLFEELRKFKGQPFVLAHELDDTCPEPTTSAFKEALSADYWVAPGIKHSFKESSPDKKAIEEYNQKIADWLLELDD